MDQKAFLTKLQKLQEREGVNMQAIITLKKEVAEGMTAREKGLVEHIVQTYLSAKFNINDTKTQAKQVGAGKQNNGKDTGSTSDKKES